MLVLKPLHTTPLQASTQHVTSLITHENPNESPVTKIHVSFS